MTEVRKITARSLVILAGLVAMTFLGCGHDYVTRPTAPDTVFVSVPDSCDCDCDDEREHGKP